MKTIRVIGYEQAVYTGLPVLQLAPDEMLVF